MNNDRTKRIIGFVFSFAVSFFVIVLVTSLYIQNKSKMEYAQMEQLVTTRANKINNVITKLLYKTQVLSALVIQSNGKIEEFDKVASTILDDPAIKNVIVAPDGIVTNVYPLKGNEKVVGFNYFGESEGNKEAILAKQTGQLVLGGPFNLIQEGQALVGRLPVYITEENGDKIFWGIVSLTLNYPQALEGAELEQLQNQGFAYEIWRISPDTNQRQIIANSRYNYNKNARYVEQPVKILNAEWYFRLSPIRNWYQYPETWIFTISGILISALIASLILHNYDLRQMKLELEDLTFNDQLTGILNRRGLFKYLKAEIESENKSFVLCYLDINKFKSINDTFGHGIGDKMLQTFTETFNKNINDKNHIFARIGGDEFILIFKDTDDIKKVSMFFENIYEKFNKSIFTSGENNINISFSVGKSVYPINGKTIDELIEFADSAMYRNKAEK